MKSIISIISVMIFSAASVSLQAASPWEYEYWFTGSGGDNAPDTPFNLRVAAPGGGQFSGGDSQGGSNNNNSAPSFSDLVNINIDDLSPQQQQQQQDTGFGSEWLIFAATDTNFFFGEGNCQGNICSAVASLDIDGPPGPGATKALVGGLEITEATSQFNFAQATLALQSCEGGFCGFNVLSDGKVVAKFGDGEKESITIDKIPVITKIEVPDNVPPYIAFEQLEQLGFIQVNGTGFDGEEQGRKGSTITVNNGKGMLGLVMLDIGGGEGFDDYGRNFINIDFLKDEGGATAQVFAITGTFSDRKNGGRNKVFGKNNLFSPEGASRDERKEISYRYVAGYTTSSTDLAKVIGDLQGRTANYKGTSLHNKYTVNLDLDFTNGEWSGQFKRINTGGFGRNQSANFNVKEGTIAGARFNGEVTKNRRIESGSVVGAILGSQAQRAAGITTVTYTDHRRVPDAFKNVTEQEAFTAGRTDLGIGDCDCEIDIDID